MGLISKTVKVRWSRSNKKYYEELGYAFTKMSDEFEVKVEDLTKGSNVKVECICDNCDYIFNYITLNIKQPSFQSDGC